MGAPGSFMRTLRRAVLLLVLGGMVLFALYTWAAWSFAYSEGERAGYVQKFSKKGWICKTWEGELAMANLPGAMPEVFSFTVTRDDVATQITGQMGERVSLHYEEHRGLPTSCFGDTSHFVTGIRRVTE
jgi:hypothetical protein